MPVGYLWTRETGLELDPDRRLQEAVRTVFRLFDRFESARQVLLHMVREGLQFPGPWTGTVTGRRGSGSLRCIGMSSRCCRTRSMLAPTRTGNRRTARRSWRAAWRRRTDTIDPWPRGAYSCAIIMLATSPGPSLNAIKSAATRFGKPAARAKAGHGARALLAGLLRCRRCGRMLQVAYTGRGTVAQYVCRVGNTMHGLSATRSMPTSPPVPASRRGARRHPVLSLVLDGKAAERLHHFPPTLPNEVLSGEQRTGRRNHTNSSPTIPGWVIEINVAF